MRDEDRARCWARSLPALPRCRPENSRRRCAFLRWLADDHFTLLGYNAYALEENVDGVQLRRVKGAGLGILRAKDDGVLSPELPGAAGGDPGARARMPAPVLTITKANTRSTVHRGTYLDFIGVKRFAPDGKVIGEHRFPGSVDLGRLQHEPACRSRCSTARWPAIVERAGFPPTGHAGKALFHILETYPRDELLQISEDELFGIAIGILQLQDRQRLRLFVRRDPFGRFVVLPRVTCPRDRYNTALRERMQQILEQAVGATESEFQAQLSRIVAGAAAVHPAHTPRRAGRARYAPTSSGGCSSSRGAGPTGCATRCSTPAARSSGNRLFDAYGRAFPGFLPGADRRARGSARHRRASTGCRGRGAGDLAMTLYRRLEDPARAHPLQADPARPSCAALGRPARAGEHGPQGAERGAEPDRSHATGACTGCTISACSRRSVGPVDVDAVREIFQDLFSGVWTGRLENDGFNRLVLAAGLSPRQIVTLRAYCRYILQIGTPFSQAYIEQTLSANPGLARDLATLFDARFDPAQDEQQRGARRPGWRSGSSSS